MTACILPHSHHRKNWRSLETGKYQPEGPLYKWETRLCQASHLSVGSQGLDLLYSMNTSCQSKWGKTKKSAKPNNFCTKTFLLIYKPRKHIPMLDIFILNKKATDFRNLAVLLHCSSSKQNTEVIQQLGTFSEVDHHVQFIRKCFFLVSIHK